MKELEKLQILKREIERHNRLYYVEQSPEISDEEYDKLLKQAEELEIKLGKESLTFGSSLSEKFSKVKHSSPMLSLSNSYSIEELKKFDERIKKISSSDYTVEEKLDGFSISLHYKGGQLVKALTRGNGLIGEDVTENVYEIENIPKTLDIDCEVRGEILMPIDAFNKLNKEGNNFANPRNAASGTIRQLDKNIVKGRGLKCFAYSIVKDIDQYDSLQLLQNLGFEVSSFSLCKNIEEVIEFINNLKEKRSLLPYQIDGVVVKVNSFEDRKKLGFTNKSPRWAIAFKYPGMQATSVIKDIKFQVGRTGVVTPVAILEPTELAGSTISKASLHNFQDIAKKDIRINDHVFIEKGGDVIPKVVKVIESKRSNSKKITIPTNCPSCSSELKENGAFLVCENIECPAKLKKQLEFFVSKEAMDISSLGPSIVERLFNLGVIKKPQDIYDLKQEDLKDLEGFKDKSINNLLGSIEESKRRSFDRVLFALGIKHLGKHSSKLLSKFSIDELKEMKLEDFESIDGIGKVIANSIYSFFKDNNNLNIIRALKERDLNFTPTVSEGKFTGKTFLVTGTLSITRTELKESIESKGGSFMSSPSKNLDYLILGDKPGSKYTKVKELIDKGYDIKIVKEEDLKNL